MTQRSPVEVRPRPVRRGWTLLATVLAAAATVVTGLWLYASPYFVVQQFKQAAASGDIEALKGWAANSGLHQGMAAIAAAARGDNVQVEAGYEALDRFGVRMRRAGGEPVRLLFHRAGLSWRLSDFQGVPADPPAEPAPPAAAPPTLASLLSRGGMPAAEFVAHGEVRPRLEKLLAGDLPVLTEDLNTSAGVRAEGGEWFLEGCSPGGCKISEAALSVDAATGDVHAAILKDGRLVVYSEKVSVIEDLPKSMQAWLDRVASDEKAGIPVSFRP